MQGIGHILVRVPLYEKIKVLWRAHKTYLSLKLRKTGPDGKYLKGESEYLAEYPNRLEDLKKGKVVKL